MPKKDKKKKGKKGSDAADAVEAVRSAVERTFQATTEGAGVTQKRTRALVDEVANAAARIRETIEDLKILEDVSGLRSEIEGLARRVAALEVRQSKHRSSRSAVAPGAREAHQAQGGRQAQAHREALHRQADGEGGPVQDPRQAVGSREGSSREGARQVGARQARHRLVLTMGAEFRSEKEFRTVMDRIFSMMSEDADMGPKLRDADVPQRFEFTDFDLVVNIRAARDGRGRQPALGVVGRRRLGAEGQDGDVVRDRQPLFPGQGERRDGARPPAHQVGRRRQGRAQPDPDHEADLRPLPCGGRGRVPASGGLNGPTGVTSVDTHGPLALDLAPPEPGNRPGSEWPSGHSQGVAARRTPPAEAAGRIARKRRDHDRGPAAFIFGVMPELTLSEVARRLDVSPATLRRWVKDGIVPLGNGRWTPAAVAHARIVARLRERGHSLDDAARGGALGPARLRLPGGPVPGRRPARGRSPRRRRRSASSPALIERIWTTAGFSSASLERIGEEDLQLLRYMARCSTPGFPLVAFLQLVRVYGQALAQIADAEVKLFHLYVHEPLMRDGVGGLEIAEAMEGLASELLPLASPIMDRVHQRVLQHFVGQDVVGHLETEGGGEELGRLRVAIAFADLAGYTRLTEEAGEEEALDVVERFVEAVEETLPDDARVIKTIGDEVMVVGADASALVDWAVGFQELNAGQAAAAADRHPLGRGALPRRRLLRPRGQPRLAGRRARRGRRGAGDAAGRRGGRRATSRSSRSARSSSRASARPPTCSWRGRR